MGAILITLGMCLDGIQARWAGHGWAWWRSKAGLLLAYLGLIGIAVKPALGWLALAGSLWFLLGATLPGAGGALKRLGSALGELLETLLQLLVNTISFIRVGAFALAHSGLAVAVSGIAESFTSVGARVAVFVLGNLFILLLEGLVVGIQATRLVLFEFFIRFLRAEGRAFHPLSAQGEDSKRQSRRVS
jgi:V/A-type H+-transporting ATPase subunit I